MLAQKQDAALQRIQTAAASLATRHDLEGQLTASLAVYDRDPDTRAVLRQEAVATLLEALVEATRKDAAPDAEDSEPPESTATVKELLAQARERGLPVPRGATKAELLTLLAKA